MKNLDTVYTDASCYESLLRFPTDVKLLWECVERAYKMMCSISSQLGEIRRQIRVHPDEGLLNDKQSDMLETITRVYRQQKNHFNSGDSRESIPNRIVSVSKPYIRPIVRGKETKIETSFTQKGRTGKNEVKNATKRERATAMEGSFGTQKEHYGLRKIAARIKSTEILLLFHHHLYRHSFLVLNTNSGHLSWNTHIKLSYNSILSCIRVEDRCFLGRQISLNIYL